MQGGEERQPLRGGGTAPGGRVLESAAGGPALLAWGRLLPVGAVEGGVGARGRCWQEMQLLPDRINRENILQPVREKVFLKTK